MKPEARKMWSTKQGVSLLDKMLTDKAPSPADLELLRKMKAADAPRQAIKPTSSATPYPLQPEATGKPDPLAPGYVGTYSPSPGCLVTTQPLPSTTTSAPPSASLPSAS